MIIHCKYSVICFANMFLSSTFASETPRGGAVVARWAHNPKVVSSSLAPATKRSSCICNCFFHISEKFVVVDQFGNERQQQLISYEFGKK